MPEAHDENPARAEPARGFSDAARPGGRASVGWGGVRRSVLRSCLFSALVYPFLLSAAHAQLNGPTPTTNVFDGPPLSYPGGNFENQYLLGVDSLPVRSPEFVAQRMVEVPTRLPGDEAIVPDDFLPSPEDPDVPVTPFTGPKLSPYKNGFFQKLSFTDTWLNRGNLNDYGVNEVEMFLTVALPCPTVAWPILITPYMNMRLLDGPKNAFLPAQLYETYVDFMWVPRVNDRFIWIFSVAPADYSDFKADGFRMTGKALFRYDIEPDKLQVIAGVLYLNRQDIRLLPAGGIIWAPNPDIRYEAIFPKPKFSHRIAYGKEWEDWLYLSGEFGGSSFAIQRPNGVDDQVVLRDWRAILGLERKLAGGAGFRLEIGYVFGRTLEYASGAPAANPGNTALVRLGIVF